MNLLMIFLTGLTTGGLSCLAMQGGLLASVIANQKGRNQNKTIPQNKNKIKNLNWQPIAMFLGMKLIAHTILGFLLGALGSVITLSLGVRLGFQVFTAIFMFATAMNLLDAHPIFRHLAFQTPKFLQRLIKNTSKSQNLFAPAILGLMTIFVPCGVTQAMEVLAINSGNPFYGALIMLFFVLGTSPLFAILGIITTKLSDNWNKKFSKLAATILIIMAIYSLNGVLLVVNAPLTINKLISPITNSFSVSQREELTTVQSRDDVQEITIDVTSRGYKPNYIKIKKGVPVKLTLQSNNVYACSLGFVLKGFGINANLKSTDSQSFTFTPTKTGKYPFTCSMGMYTGILEVI